MPRFGVFLDDGGVMSDNRRRGAQWQRLVGAFFAPRLGGMEEAWAAANGALATAFFDPAAWRSRLAAAADYRDFERTYLLDWLSMMCAAVGVPCPAEEQSLILTREAEAWITQQVEAALPGVVEAIGLLYAQGYALHTASGESSMQLANYLNTMGVRACFGRLYGPDLINSMKAGPEYYARVLDDAGIASADALVVDDSIEALQWAAQVGIRTVLVGPLPAPDERSVTWHITSLAELPALLAQLDVGRLTSKRS